MLGSVRVVVGNDDVNGVILQTNPGRSIQGELEVEGVTMNFPAPTRVTVQMALLNEAVLTDQAFPGKRPYVALSAENKLLEGPRPAAVLNQGSFEFVGVDTAAYQLTVGDMPEGSYVKSVRLGDKDVTNAPITANGESLKIVISPRGGDVNGVLEPEALPAGRVVMLWPLSPNRGTPLLGVRRAATDQEGKFRITGLPPGAYRIAAWDDPDVGALWNYDLLQKFVARAARVEVSEGERVDVRVPLIPANDFAEALKQLN